MPTDISAKLVGLPPVVREYCMSKLVIENKSPKTVEEYAGDLRIFLKFMMVHKGLSKARLTDYEEFSSIDISGVDIAFLNTISTIDVYEYLIYAQSVRGNEWCARARKLSAVKNFFKYITIKMHLTENNPVKDIESPKPKKTLPKFLSLEEAQALLKAVLEDEESPFLDRDYAIITLFLNCGMRLSELVGINKADISADLSTIRVVGKGAKERVLYLNTACKDAIVSHLTVQNKRLDIKDTNALFLSRLGTRISVKTVQWMVKKYLERAGLENKKMSVHKLRHTAATLMYRTGKVDVRVLKDILGHEQLNTTQIYTHVSDDSMRAAAEANPMANIKK